MKEADEKKNHLYEWKPLIIHHILVGRDFK